MTRPFPLSIEERRAICRGLHLLKTLTTVHSSEAHEVALRQVVTDLIRRLQPTDAELRELTRPIVEPKQMRVSRLKAGAEP